MAEQTPRRDLPAMIGPLARALVEAELPVLRAHGLTMWAYSVLCTLGEEPSRTQTALAKAIGADKTRIIGVLDELQRGGLIERSPDPEDRRANLLSLTARGTEVCAAAQAEIQRHEERVLSRLSTVDRAAFLRALATLSALPRDEVTGAVPNEGDAAL